MANYMYKQATERLREEYGYWAERWEWVIAAEEAELLAKGLWCNWEWIG